MGRVREGAWKLTELFAGPNRKKTPRPAKKTAAEAKRTARSVTPDPEIRKEASVTAGTSAADKAIECTSPHTTEPPGCKVLYQNHPGRQPTRKTVTTNRDNSRIVYAVTLPNLPGGDLADKTNSVAYPDEYTFCE
jgi:hypothetical protein